MKRILALDGGGVRGMFSLQILARIEALLREREGKPDLRLSDAFDLIAGTSTGAIIAAFLAWGKSVAEIERLYTDFGPVLFQRQRWYRRWHSKYQADPVADLFKQHFCEDDGRTPASMGSARLRTLLLILMRNATTGSPWPVSNNPAAYYNERARTDCNLDVPLWQILRASTAAPTYFPPERIAYGTRHFTFVDGGVTPYNNPALIAILTATLPQYHLAWPTGRTALHVISIGTGQERTHLPDIGPDKINLMEQVEFVAPALLDAIEAQQDTLCRVLGDCVHGDIIDREIGALDAPTLFGPAEQKFTYVRYNQMLDGAALAGPGKPPLDLELDRVENIPTFQRIGREYAEKNVRVEHLYPRAASR